MKIRRNAAVIVRDMDFALLMEASHITGETRRVFALRSVTTQTMGRFMLLSFEHLSLADFASLRYLLWVAAKRGAKTDAVACDASSGEVIFSKENLRTGRAAEWVRLLWSTLAA